MNSLETSEAKPRIFQTMNDVENFEIFSTMGSVLYHYSPSFFRGLNFTLANLDMAMSRIFHYSPSFLQRLDINLYNPGHGHVQDFTILDMGKFNQYFSQDTSEKCR